MDLAELDKLIAKLRATGVRRFVGTLGGYPVEIELGDPPRADVASSGPSLAKAKEDRVRRRLDEEWAHVGGPPPFVARDAFADAETESAMEPD